MVVGKGGEVVELWEVWEVEVLVEVLGNGVGVVGGG